MAKLLIVDDEIGIRELLSEILRDEGHDVILASNAAAARAARNASRPDMVLLDIWMPDTDGITLLREWAAAGQLTMPVVMMSGHGTIDTAVEATRIGAIDYLEKPISLQKLLATVKRGLQHPPPAIVPVSLTLAAFPDSAPLRDLYRSLRQIAGQSRLILLRVGADHLAELAARSLQTMGTPWLDFGSAALDPAQLAEHQGGQLYLPGLERLSRGQQKNLATIIERLERHDLNMLVASGASREELLAAGWDAALVERLFAQTLIPPAFADIRDEIPELARRILRHLVNTKEVPQRHLSPLVLTQLQQRDWRGGYGELYATIRGLALAATGEEINLPEFGLLFPAIAETSSCLISLDQPLREAREMFERIYFEHHLRLADGNITRVARKTGLERTHLYRKLKQLGLHSGRRNEED
ncbi:MAG: response regulator [Azoarcus sp.]|jgi:DNA-binding NtrC family response regulator|nr:response regulator [Azoarcus sp.]